MTRASPADRYAHARYVLHGAERSLAHELHRHYERPCPLSREHVCICVAVLRLARTAYYSAWVAYTAAQALGQARRVMEMV